MDSVRRIHRIKHMVVRFFRIRRKLIQFPLEIRYSVVFLETLSKESHDQDNLKENAYDFRSDAADNLGCGARICQLNLPHERVFA